MVLVIFEFLHHGLNGIVLILFLDLSFITFILAVHADKDDQRIFMAWIVPIAQKPYNVLKLLTACCIFNEEGYYFRAN